MIERGTLSRLTTVADNFIFLKLGLDRMSAALDNLTTQVNAALAEIAALVAKLQTVPADDSAQLNSLASQIQASVAAAQAALPPAPAPAPTPAPTSASATTPASTPSTSTGSVPPAAGASS